MYLDLSDNRVSALPFLASIATSLVSLHTLVQVGRFGKKADSSDVKTLVYSGTFADSFERCLKKESDYTTARPVTTTSFFPCRWDVDWLFIETLKLSYLMRPSVHKECSDFTREVDSRVTHRYNKMHIGGRRFAKFDWPLDMHSCSH